MSYGFSLPQTSPSPKRPHVIDQFLCLKTSSSQILGSFGLILESRCLDVQGSRFGEGSGLVGVLVW